MNLRLASLVGGLSALASNHSLGFPRWVRNSGNARNHPAGTRATQTTGTSRQQQRAKLREDEYGTYCSIPGSQSGVHHDSRRERRAYARAMAAHQWRIMQAEKLASRTPVGWDAVTA